jgi:N-acetyl-gamma-glutamyl-phosphate reductase
MLRVAVAGASGYMGAELLRLLSVHPKVQLTAVTSERLAGERLDKVYPHFRGLSPLVFQEVDADRLAADADLVFLALPHMESQRAVPILRRQGRKVIDLSADYRLRDASLYATWYKAPHIDAPGLAEAVYGLPELHRKAVAQASLVASPGCYPMGAILATAPLMKSGLGSREGIVVDGKSGVTGAGAQGRKIDPMYLYTEANENVQAYGMATHRHTPEMEQEMSALAGGPVVVAFTPHLVPLNRGLFTTASVPLTRASAPRTSSPSTRSSTRASPSCACCPRASGRPRGTSWARTSATSPWSPIPARGGRCASPPSTISARAGRPTASRI